MLCLLRTKTRNVEHDETPCSGVPTSPHPSPANHSFTEYKKVIALKKFLFSFSLDDDKTNTIHSSTEQILYFSGQYGHFP